MPCAIMRFSKGKGGRIGSTEAHNERRKKEYKSNPDIDTNKIKNDYHIIQPPRRYHAEIHGRIQAAKCRVRRDSTKFVETLITASPEFMNALPLKQQREYFERATEFIKREVGEQNVFAAVVHMDEKTPHMHLCFVPLTQDNRLSAKDVLGDRQKLIQWQDKYHAYMSERWPQLERGISAEKTQRKHIPVWMFKMADKLDKQLLNIEKAMDDISPFNAKKKRDEAMEQLKIWYPKAQRFSAQFNSLRGMNDTLKWKLDDAQEAVRGLKNELAEKDKDMMDMRMEYVHLEHVAAKQQRLINKVPDDVLEQIQAKERSRQRSR